MLPSKELFKVVMELDGIVDLNENDKENIIYYDGNEIKSFMFQRKCLKWIDGLKFKVDVSPDNFLLISWSERHVTRFGEVKYIPCYKQYRGKDKRHAIFKGAELIRQGLKLS